MYLESSQIEHLERKTQIKVSILFQLFLSLHISQSSARQIAAHVLVARFVELGTKRPEERPETWIITLIQYLFEEFVRSFLSTPFPTKNTEVNVEIVSIGQI